MDVNIAAIQSECESGFSRPDLGSLLTVVSMLIDDQRSVVLHVTSSRRGEGTTTVARELAAAVARSSWGRVALIDAGPPEPSLPVPTALLDALERTEEPVMRRARINGAEVAVANLIGGRRVPPKLDGIRKLYGWLRSEYTLAVIDCPAVLDTRDACVLASAADGTLLVVEAERTRLSEINRTREILDQVGAVMIGMVLNKRQYRVPRLLERLL